MSADALAKAWADLEAAGGRFASIESVVVEPKGRPPARARHRALRLLRKILRVSVDAQGKVGGFFHGPVPADLEQATRAMIDKLAHGDAASAAASFDLTMAGALPRTSSRRGVGADPGPGRRVRRGRERADDHRGRALDRVRAVSLRRHRPGGEGGLRHRNRVAGLFFLPPGSDPTAEWKPPPYVQPERFTERACRWARRRAAGQADVAGGGRAVPGGGARPRIGGRTTRTSRWARTARSRISPGGSPAAGSRCSGT